MVLVKEVLRRFFDVSGKSVADKRSFTVLPPGCTAINSKKNNAPKIALHCIARHISKRNSAPKMSSLQCNVKYIVK